MSVFCSQCTYPMKLVHITDGGPADPNGGPTGPWFFAGASFECTNCEQHAHVRPDGSGSMTIATLFPQPKTAKDHHDYVDYWLREKLMFLAMRCAANYITTQKYYELEKEFKDAASEYKAEHPIPPTFWERIRGKKAAV